MEFKFKKENCLEVRKADYERVIEEHPGKIAIICEKIPNNPIPEIIQTKYLINEDFSLSHFTTIIRKKLNIKDTQALFFLANGKITLVGNETMGEIYNKYKDEDGFLYIAYASELVWGHNF